MNAVLGFHEDGSWQFPLLWDRHIDGYSRECLLYWIRRLNAVYRQRVVGTPELMDTHTLREYVRDLSRSELLKSAWLHGVADTAAILQKQYTI